MPVSIRRWLEVQGFERNPFEYYEADREERLASYFIEPEWFEALRGDTRQPASAVLFAPRGHGKTSQRLQIARLCGVDAQHPALVVQITDYKWLPDDLARLTATDYLRYIAGRAAQQLWERYSADAEVRERFTAQPFELLRLHALRFWAAVPAYRIRLPEPVFEPATLATLARRLRLPAALDDPQLLVEQFAQHYDGMTDGDLQAELLELARLAGFVSLYVLIDRTDEDLQTAHNLETVVARIKPLISDLPVIEHVGFAFKFFLPDTLELLLMERRIGRVGERPPSYPLRWRESDLLSMLARRLQTHSQLPGRVTRAARVNRFQDLCATGGNVDLRLVRAAECSPRRMIQLARELIEQHCSEVDDAERKLGPDLIERLIPAPIPLISLDADGFICFNGRRDESVKLTSKDREILAALWSHRGQIIAKRTLTRAIYGKDEPNDVEALEKAVKRLRHTIAASPHAAKGVATYLDYVRLAGYRLINYAPDASLG